MTAHHPQTEKGNAPVHSSPDSSISHIGPSHTGVVHPENPRCKRMRQKLEEALSPSYLVIRDDSARHAGHAGIQTPRQKVRGPSSSLEDSSHPEPEDVPGETHYHITLKSAAFSNLSKLAQHRLVHMILADEFALGLHALSLHTAPCHETECEKREAGEYPPAGSQPNEREAE